MKFRHGYFPAGKYYLINLDLLFLPSVCIVPYFFSVVELTSGDVDVQTMPHYISLCVAVQRIQCLSCARQGGMEVSILQESVRKCVNIHT